MADYAAEDLPISNVTVLFPTDCPLDSFDADELVPNWETWSKGIAFYSMRGRDSGNPSQPAYLYWTAYRVPDTTYPGTPPYGPVIEIAVTALGVTPTT
jgi:hypothetical protein